MSLNSDFSKVVLMHSADMDWQASPSATVWRKRFDLAGSKEASRVTSVVRYDPNSKFHSHPHPDGEEILVLDGIFSDDLGDHPAGSYLLNPEGYSHAPYSDDGCIIFVKLRQYQGLSRQQIALHSHKQAWQEDSRPGLSKKCLYEEEGQTETVYLYQFEAGTELAEKPDGGGEVFVIKGSLESPQGTLKAGSWLRLPSGEELHLKAEDLSEIYLKRGHLA